MKMIKPSQMQEISGLTPLNYSPDVIFNEEVRATPLLYSLNVIFYEEDRATPLSSGKNDLMRRSLIISVDRQITMNEKGRSPIIFVTRNETENQRGVALKS